MQGKKTKVNEDKVKQALLIATNQKLKDVSDEKLKDMMKEKLNPEEIEEVIKRKKNIPQELFNKTAQMTSSVSDGESRMGRILSTVITGFNIASLAVLSSIGTSYLVHMTRERRAMIEQQVQNGKIEEQVNSFNGRLRLLESDMALLPARYVGKEELNEKLNDFKEEAKETPQKKKLVLGMRSQTLRGRMGERSLDLSQSLPLQMGQQDQTGGDMNKSGNLDVLKGEVKMIGENLSKIAEELGKVREREAGGRDAMEKTLKQLIEIQRCQNEQLQCLIQKVGDKSNDNERQFNYQDTQRSEILRNQKSTGEIEPYEIEDELDRAEDIKEEVKEKREEEESKMGEVEEENGEHRNEEQEVSIFEQFIGKFEEKEVRTQVMKVLSAPLKLISMSKDQAAKARINPNNPNFKVIFDNSGADEFLTYLGFKKSYSSIYEFQSQNWEEQVVKIKDVQEQIAAYLKKN